MGYRFNPPPNWPPLPSADWTPPPGWAPHPSWGPAPQGWSLWVEDPAYAGVPTFVPPAAPGPSPALVARARGVAIRNAVLGAVIMLVGLTVSVWSYAAAGEGGHFVVAWGAVVFGGWRFLRGLYQLSNPARMLANG